MIAKMLRGADGKHLVNKSYFHDSMHVRQTAETVADAHDCMVEFELFTTTITTDSNGRKDVRRGVLGTWRVYPLIGGERKHYHRVR